MATPKSKKGKGKAKSGQSTPARQGESDDTAGGSP